MKGLLSGLLVLTVALSCHASEQQDEVIVLTVASNQTEGYQRYLRSAKVYGISVTTLGVGLKWTGGDMNFAGGGLKINLLKDHLKTLQKQGTKDDAIVLFSDSYDMIFLGSVEDIVAKFKKFSDARVVFSAEQFCWPKEDLVSEYPVLEGKGNPYLNSGGFIGYFKEINEIVNHRSIKDKEDDQLYYTQVYLDKELREKLKIKLDHKSEIFQNLNGAYGEIELNFDSKPFAMIKNTVYATEPLLLHGNGPSKTVFNSLSSYVPKAWSETDGCISCKEQRRIIDEKKLPSVLLILFIQVPTPFIEEYFLKIYELNYPKNKLHVFIHNSVEYHNKDIEIFSKNFSQYLSVKQIQPSDNVDEATARMLALDYGSKKKCKYFFTVDSIVHLDNRDTLKQLLEVNMPVVAPLVVRPGKAWSNFWGALTKEGFYERSTDYMDIVHLVRRGVWNVPFINSCYLIKADFFKNYTKEELTFKGDNVDPDMQFCASLRKLGIFMHVTNEKDYGHLIDPETFDITLTNPDVYQIFENKWDWEMRYISEDYAENFNLENKPQQPCPDVYWFPMTTMRFCKEYIEVMEAFGKWSDGSNNDKRLEGGYEAVPTRDIHTNQVGFERHWLHILKEYVRPLQELVFTGYFHDPPRSLMNFVVRYKPDEQPSLRPHHDSSTYTINLALNTADVDYQGGGCHFIRYNCSVTKTRPGWLLMHPGRLTHYHEGLLVTEGVRYIMISFVDP